MTDDAVDIDAFRPHVECGEDGCRTLVPPSEHNWRCRAHRQEHQSTEHPTRQRLVDRATAIAAVAHLAATEPQVMRRVLTRLAEQHPNAVWWAIHDATTAP